MTWRVIAEAPDGFVGTLRKGFPTKDAAEDHPVKMNLWKRVWVEEEPVPYPQTTKRTLATPWVHRIEGRFDYLIDAGGARIASLLGTAAEKEKMIEVLRAAGICK